MRENIKTEEESNKEFSLGEIEIMGQALFGNSGRDEENIFDNGKFSLLDLITQHGKDPQLQDIIAFAQMKIDEKGQINEKSLIRPLTQRQMKKNLKIYENTKDIATTISQEELELLKPQIDRFYEIMIEIYPELKEKAVDHGDWWNHV